MKLDGRIACRSAAKWLELDPSGIMMVACHNFDLNALRACGYKSAFVKRPADPTPNPAYDQIVESFPELAQGLGA